MKIELKMSDDTFIIMEDSSDGIDIEFSRWSYNDDSIPSHEKDYTRKSFMVLFRNDIELKEFITAIKLLGDSFNGIQESWRY